MRVNAALTRTKDGYDENTDAAAITADGRIEGFLHYPDYTEAEAGRRASATVSALKSPRWQTVVGIEPTNAGDVPFADFTIGDYITVPDQNGTPALQRVLGLTLTEDEAGNVMYRPEVGSVIPSMDQRQATINRSMNAGTLGGRDPQAQPRSGGATSSSAAKVASAPIGQAAKESILFEQEDDAVVVNQSRNVPVRVGGVATIVAEVSSNFTTAAELTLYRNGVAIGSPFTLVTGQSQHVSSSYASHPFASLDTVAIGVTNAGAGGQGLVVSVWFD